MPGANVAHAGTLWEVRWPLAQVVQALVLVLSVVLGICAMGMWQLLKCFEIGHSW